MRLYAYCRVSTERQKLDRQIDNIKAAYPAALFFCDKFTGSTLDRPEWNRLYRRLETGDTIIFDSVSRMSRDAESGAALYQELYERGINLVFLNEPHCNTDCYRQAAAANIPATGNEIADIYIDATNRVLMILARRQIEIAFEQAEKERADICKRVKDGMRAAREAAALRGEEVTFGQRAGVTLETEKSRKAKEIICKHSKRFDGTLNDTEVMRLAGISHNTFYKYKRELKQ